MVSVARWASARSKIGWCRRRWRGCSGRCSKATFWTARTGSDLAAARPRRYITYARACGGIGGGPGGGGGLASLFATVNHEWLRKFVRHRANDGGLIRLLNKWLKAGVMENG